MSARLDSMIDEWARDVMSSIHKSDFPGINAVEKILKDPGISTKGAKHAILWWPENRRLAKMSRAMHQVTPIEQIILIIDCNLIVNDDKSKFTKKDLAKCSSIKVREFNDLLKKTKFKLSRILYT